MNFITQALMVSMLLVVDNGSVFTPSISKILLKNKIDFSIINFDQSKPVYSYDLSYVPHVPIFTYNNVYWGSCLD